MNLKNVNNLKYVKQSYSSITLNSNGWCGWKDTVEGVPAFDGTLAFITIETWNSNNGKCFMPTNGYLMGEANATITGLLTRWWYY